MLPHIRIATAFIFSPGDVAQAMNEARSQIVMVAPIPSGDSFLHELAGAGGVGYVGTTVIRRSASFLALLALIATPAVTSTRLFCRFTGQEIIGCAESNAPDHSEVRGEGCCQHRTFRALDGVRLLEEQRQQIPAAVAIDAPAGWAADVLAVAPPAVRLTATSSAGPSAFLSHRALLI